MFLVCFTAAPAAVRPLLSSEHAAVHSIEEYLTKELSNSSAKELTRGVTLSDPNLSGLSGDGQIVGVADTGLDMGSCFFRDSNEKVAFARWVQMRTFTQG